MCCSNYLSVPWKPPRRIKSFTLVLSLLLSIVHAINTPIFLFPTTESKSTEIQKHQWQTHVKSEKSKSFSLLGHTVPSQRGRQNKILTTDAVAKTRRVDLVTGRVVFVYETWILCSTEVAHRLLSEDYLPSTPTVCYKCQGEETTNKRLQAKFRWRARPTRLLVLNRCSM